MALWRLFLASPEKSKSRGHSLSESTALRAKYVASEATLMGFLEGCGTFFRRRTRCFLKRKGVPPSSEVAKQLNLPIPFHTILVFILEKALIEPFLVGN